MSHKKSREKEQSTPAPSTVPPLEALYLNRELSWLDFNSRVLELAGDDSLPVLERARFLAIFRRNLDEFFQVRVALLRARRESGVSVRTPDGRTPTVAMEDIRERVLHVTRIERELFAKELRPQLAMAGIAIVKWSDLEKKDRKHLRQIFDEQIFPVLTPLAVDPSHPFPYVSNLSFNLAAVVRNPDSESTRFARIKVPPILGRFLALPDGERFLPIEQLIAAHLDRLFPGMEIESSVPFRVTRDAELALEEEDAADLMKEIESRLTSRDRKSDAVRLEVERSISPQALELLLDELELTDEDVYVHRGLLDLGSLWELTELDRPELKFEPGVSRTPPEFATSEPTDRPDIFAALRESDVLVHHPYDSFDSSVLAFFEQAADDPHVLAIKHTIYRTAGPDSRIGRALIRAAGAGKQVVTLVELKARFDEEKNIEWARSLEQAGVHVLYGIVGLKTHGKIVMVVRQEAGGLRRYCHFGTGNYHPGTARLYEDLGLFTADADLGADLSDLFNHLTGFSQYPEYRKIRVAPECLRVEMVREIEAEMAHSDGQVFGKFNSLSDTGMIDHLYAASSAGVKVDLVVRGICCLRPGIPGKSENITVRSVLGRYLEHSRFLRFGSEARGYRYYIGSADWMGRNLDSRVEVVVPIEDERLQRRLDAVAELLLADDVGAWSMGSAGDWKRVPTTHGVGCQAELQARRETHTI